jgi:O-antigen ligase
MSALAGRSGSHLLLYGGALLIAVAGGAALAYSPRFLGDSGPYLLVGTLLAAIVAGAILLQWRLGALLLVASLPYEAAIANGTVAIAFKALALLTFVALALALLRDRELFGRLLSLWRQPLTLAVLTFTLWVLGSILWASNKEAALGDTFTFLGVFGLMVVIGLLDSRFLMLVWAGLVLSAALSVPAAYVLPLPEGSDMLRTGRFGPGGAGANSYACLVVITFFVAYFGLLRRHKAAAYLLALVLFFAIFATESRTGLITLFATPLVALFAPRMAARLGSRTIHMYVLGIAILAVVILAVPGIGEAAAERYATLSQVQSEDTWNGRLNIWQAASQVIASRPLVGVGVGNFAEAAVDYSSFIARKSVAQGEVSGDSHNVFLTVTSELGVVGLVLFLGILFSAFKAALRVSQRSALGTGVFLGLIVFVIQGMSLTWELVEIWYVLLGSVLALQLQRPTRRATFLPNKQEGTPRPMSTV